MRPNRSPKSAGALAGQVIVLLEDDELIRRATERVLRRFGATVVTGSTSGEVLADLTSRQMTPSCVIADYWLGRQEDGLSAAATVRAATNPSLRGLIITGDFSAEIAENVNRAGFSLLRKPVNIDSLLDALPRKE